MPEKDAEILDKIRRQFDFGPYPQLPLEKSPQDDLGVLYIHSLATAYYLRNRQFIDAKGKVILDAGCGTGYKSLALAQANPGAKIVGVDLSEQSIELARKRLDHYNFKNVEFFVLSLYDLPSLGLEFDYINCDEVLYLIPEPVRGLQAMKAVLKPDGIIRSNLHSQYQRMNFFRAQKLFATMGLMDENPEEMALETAVETMKSLQDWVNLKKTTWREEWEKEEPPTQLLSNQLLQGDRGFTMPEVFSLLEAADLEFINMVNWRQWDIEQLFKESDNLPVFWALALPEATLEEKLQLFELLHPVHRLLDFWCGHRDRARPFTPVAEWREEDWESAIVNLHPMAKMPQIREALEEARQKLQLFPLSQKIPIAGGRPVSLDITVAFCLFPLLFESPQSLSALVERWQTLRPVHLATLEPTTRIDSDRLLKNTLTGLEALGYAFLTQS
ncbi:MAG: class I SAM-dependent methyltransferase [Spirulina sp.]